MRLDSHVHFWKYNPVRDNWIDDTMPMLKRDFLPTDIEKEIKANGIAGCIAVQAAQDEAETLFLAKLAQDNAFIKGVVGWTDLTASNAVERLQYFSEWRIVKGFRHILQSEPEAFFTNSYFVNSLNCLAKFDFTFDLLITHQQVPIANALLQKLSGDVKIIVDHGAKPAIRLHEIVDWKREIKKLALHPQLYCKLSGLLTEGDWEKQPYKDVKPYLDVIVEAFGTKRICFGSDWPVMLLASKYATWMSMVEDYFSGFSAAERSDVLGGNAIRFYKI